MASWLSSSSRVDIDKKNEFYCVTVCLICLCPQCHLLRHIPFLPLQHPQPRDNKVSEKTTLPLNYHLFQTPFSSLTLKVEKKIVDLNQCRPLVYKTAFE